MPRGRPAQALAGPIKLLADNTKSSTLVGVPYTPLAQNPKGGESIALYFEYDSDILHPRAQKFVLDDKRLAPVFAIAAERRVSSLKGAHSLCCPTFPGFPVGWG